MVSVRINGEDSSIRTDGLSQFTDVVELIKSVIDPEHIITGILIDGRELEETDWVANPSQFSTSIVEVLTDTAENFVTFRLCNAAEVVRECALQFVDAREKFQAGNMQDANQSLGTAVNTLQAFFEWYGTLMELLSPADQAKFDLTQPVEEISEVCKRICQQQLYQSWWALGETLQNDLEPKLEGLERTCRKFKSEILAK